ncbi:ANTH-domain-containing protein [Tilletiaria anomala UBC 951]|uniref:ANTH-domain-containing protein n=1 Tax=Tilletiaria anomala (strain ATCC 24038 / CBS 436.72 / UBC 951) TaxID=1037660 RepID=A0A066VKQ3_TILAU|nr:ANTH-domain-containing protein [Tilletiaria anomala UBC 951]KDN42076.1 ANTH-domain-containing protein [Tilletiaria anomala UBC 951]
MSSTYDKIVKSATKPKGSVVKSKYLDPILASTFAQDRSLLEVCRSLGSRLRERDPVVIYKSLIILHTMIRNGGVENVLSHVLRDETGAQLKILAGRSSSSTTPRAPRIIRAYAAFLDDRVRAFRELGHDVIRSSDSSRENGSGSRENATGDGNRLRRLTVDKGLLREVGITQKVGNAALNCDFFLEDLRDELNLAAFRLSFKDVLVLYAAINEGVINILEHYFEMAKSDAERALELYKRFCTQTEKVVAYMAAARKVSGSLNLTVPSLKHAPLSLAGALQEYLEDPNFEKNRLEYKENKRIADGGAPRKASKGAAKANTSNVKEGEKRAEDEKKVAAPAVKPPTSNQAVQDFFASIESNDANNMFSMGPQDAWAGAYGSFGIQPQITGFPGGMDALQPQMTGYNPFLSGMISQPTGYSGMQLQQPQPFMQPQTTGFLQPQATGFNPFRQSVMVQPAGGFGSVSPFGTFGQPGGTSSMGAANGTHIQPQQSMFPLVNTSQSQSSIASEMMLSANSITIAPSSTATAPAPTLTLASASAPKPSAAVTATPAPKAVLPQKTGSRNPFASPAVSTPPPDVSKPQGLTLAQLASGAGNAPPGGNYGLGANAWDGTDPTKPGGLQPQQTGIMGSVASELAFVKPQQNGNSAGSSASSTVPNQPNGSAGLDSSFAEMNLGALGNGTTTASQSPSTAAVSATPLAAQPTGFGGIKPFKPESSFGASLASNPAFTLPGPDTPGASALSPQLTSNPFTRPNAGAGAGLGPSSSLFGTPSTHSNSLPSGPTATTGTSSFLFAQPSAFGPLMTQATGFGSFSSQQPLSAAASSPFMLSASASQSTQQQQQAIGLSSSFAPASSLAPSGSSALTAQPTGFAGSTIKPFQPTSAFGAAAFGAMPSSPPQQQQGPQPGQQGQQHSAFASLI